MWDKNQRQISVTKHIIDPTNPNTRSIHSDPYWAGPRQLQLKRDEIHEMLRDEVVNSVTTEWASSVVFAQKKNGGFRSCVEYQKRNTLTMRDSSSIPKID